MSTDLLPLAAAGPNLWRVKADERYWNALGPWGGWTAGALLKAVLVEPEARGAPVAMTINIMAGFEKEDVMIATRRMRQGGSLEFWNVELSQGEKICAQAMVTLAERRETDRFVEAPLPAAPVPEEVTPPPPREGNRLAFGAMFESRPVKGMQPFTQDGDTQTISWVRDIAKAPLDYVLLAMYADIFAPRIFYKAGFRPVSTISMNVYFHATPEQVAAVADDYVLTEAVSRGGGGGFFDQQAALWSRHGVLLATTEQLSWFK